MHRWREMPFRELTGWARIARQRQLERITADAKRRMTAGGGGEQ